MISVVDISIPFYDQLCELEGEVSENIAVTANTQFTQVRE